MRHEIVLRLFGLGLVLGAGVAMAQTPAPKKHPILVDDGYADSHGYKAKYRRTNNLSMDGNAAVKQQRIVSVPSWNGAFTTVGTTYPYTMVGGDPRKGDTTRVDTQLISIQFFFDEFVDQNGNNIVIDAAPILPAVQKGPDFDPFAYGTGTTQFADAIQRAEFFNVMQKDWHTLINDPRMLTPVQIEVPVGQSLVFQTRGGAFFALINFDFFISQLNTIIQLEPLDVHALSIVLTRNGLFYEGDPSNCCVLGFHTAFETQVQGNKHFVQTFATASWLDRGHLPRPGHRRRSASQPRDIRVDGRPLRKQRGPAVAEPRRLENLRGKFPGDRRSRRSPCASGVPRHDERVHVPPADGGAAPMVLARSPLERLPEGVQLS